MRRKKDFIMLLGGAISVLVCVSAAAQEGYYGAGHDKWHEGLYSKLNRNDGKGSCCNLMDCRPTQSRMVGDHYEVKVDGEWMPVPNDKISNVVAPDGGAHVCAPRQIGQQGRSILRHPPVGGLRSAVGRVSRKRRVSTAARNCTRDEGGPFEVGNQVLISSHRKLLWSKAMVVSVAETSGR